MGVIRTFDGECAEVAFANSGPCQFCGDSGGVLHYSAFAGCCYHVECLERACSDEGDDVHELVLADGESVSDWTADERRRFGL